MDDTERQPMHPPVASTWINSDSSFRLLVEAVRDYAIFMLDPEGYVRSWNPGAERAKGYQAEEIIGRHFSIFYTPEDRAVGLPEMVLNNARQLGRFEHEGWRMRKDGSLFWADVVITAVQAPDGSLVGFAKVTRDMTEKRHLTLLRDEAVRASQAKSAFLANMSHELRTPLNAIIGYSEMVAEELRECGMKHLAEDLEKIRYSGHHLLSVVSDVLDLSRIEAGRLVLYPERVDIAGVVRDVVETARPLAARNDNRIEISISKDGTRALADPVRLRQVLYNVFSNACKFTQNGTISVMVGAPDPEQRNRAAVVIQDSGRGMSKDQLHRVFERFYQVESAARSGGGTGLGLAISKLLCEAMGGDILVTSTLGKGSTFTVVLPKAEPTSQG